MPAKPYEDTEKGQKKTQGTGNAKGKPIIPVLFGVAAVIALILITLSVSRRPRTVNKGTSESGPIPEVQYSPAGVSDVAVGQQGGTFDTASRPATAPIASPGSEGMSSSGSSSLPAPAPSMSPVGTRNSSGQNVIAPPGPSVNGQEYNR